MGESVMEMKPSCASHSKKTMRPPVPQRNAGGAVLVAVTGMSPAVLTETMWALAHERPPVRPRKVVAFCTLRSREQVRRELLHSGVWESLRQALKAGPDELEFGDTGDHLRVFTHRTRELDDIRTPQESAAVADFLLEHLRQFTENPEVRIVASIAGGRKTMGALLYGCMTLIGRDTDRITHVLVDEALEQRRDPKFYFPQNVSEVHALQLADIPFVPLRNGFAELGRMPGGFLSLVRHYSRHLQSHEARPVQIRLDDARQCVAVDGKAVTLRPRAYLTLKFAITLNTAQRVPIGIDVSEEEFKAFIRDSDIPTAWARTLDVKNDLRRELGEIRRVFRQAGIAWMPGLRRDALRLPPFRLLAP
mgnify:CR=1 FL=1